MPVNYSKIMEVACDMALHEIKFKTRNYFVLIIISAGCVDDYEESLKEVQRASGLPLSIMLLKVGNVQLQEDNDPGEFIGHCSELFEKCERKFIEQVVYEPYKMQNRGAQFEAELIRKIPEHVQKYMEINAVPAYGE